MKVSDVKSARSVSAPKKKNAEGAKGADFASHLAEAIEAGAAPSVQDAGPVAGVEGILATQETGDATEDEGRRSAMRRGLDILDRLEEIRRDILLGALSKERLMNLAKTLRARREAVADPRLIAIIDEIELRAEVEIAKFTR